MMNDIMLFDDLGEDLYIGVTEYDLDPYCTLKRRKCESWVDKVFDFDAMEFESIPETPQHNEEDGNLEKSVMWIVPSTPTAEVSSDKESPLMSTTVVTDTLDSPFASSTVVVGYAETFELEPHPPEPLLLDVDTVVENNSIKKKMHKSVYEGKAMSFSMYGPEKLEPYEVMRSSIQAMSMGRKEMMPLKPPRDKKHKHKHRSAASCKSKSSTADISAVEDNRTGPLSSGYKLAMEVPQKKFVFVCNPSGSQPEQVNN